MFSMLKNSLAEAKSDIPEVKNVEKSLFALEAAIVAARSALSNKIMSLVEQDKVQDIYKIKNLVAALNSDDVSRAIITLSSPLANKRPKAVMFAGKESKQNTWRGVTEFILGCLHDENKSMVQSLPTRSEFQAKKPYFAKTADGMDAPVMLGSGNGAVFADSARITNNEFFFLKKTLRAFNHDPDEVSIEIDPDYTRKGTAKAKAPKLDVSSKIASASTSKRKVGRPKKSQQNKSVPASPAEQSASL